MSKPKITTHDEVVNKYIGEQGTPKRDKFDAELEAAKIEAKIENVFSKFHFNRVREAMQVLDWTWESFGDKVPSIEHMKEYVAMMIKDLLSDKQAKGVSSGGFVVTKEGDDIVLEFILCSAYSGDEE